MELPSPDFVTGIAEAIALFGVFAILPLSVAIFYFTYTKVDNKDPEIRKHCIKVNWVFVVTTVLAMTAAGIVQYLANSVSTLQVLRGSVSDLSDQSDLPDPSPGSGKTVQRMKARHNNTAYYYETGHSHDDPLDGRYRSQWLLARDRLPSKVVFGIRQVYKWSAAEPSLANPNKVDNRPAERVSDKYFMLDLDSFPQLRKSPINLVYRQGRTPRDSIGSLAVSTDDGSVPLRVVDSEEVIAERSVPPSGAGRVGGLFVTPAYAQIESRRRAAASDTIIKADGSYDSTAGNRIARRLQSDDLVDQEDARDVLVAHGGSSCSLIGDALAKAKHQADERGVLIHNLALSLEEIERRSPKACQDTYLPFALAYYDVKDFRSAARFFERVPDDSIRGIGLYHRGYAYYIAGGRDSTAIRELRRYLSTHPAQPMQAATHVVLGRLLQRGAQKAQAIGEFRAALALLPEKSLLRALSFNDLAYLYSQLFPQVEDSLRAAVLLADQALSYTPQQPAWLDTKGWLAYQLRDCAAAERLLSSAATKEPSNPTIRAHLEQVRREQKGPACRRA